LIMIQKMFQVHPFRSPVCGLLVPVAVFLVMAGTAVAQDLEPRSFSQAPVGMNFVALNYGYASGEVLFDQAVPITEAHGRVNTLAAAYVRTLSVFGASAKLTGIIPYAWGHWQGLLDGEYASTSRTGLADPRVQLAVNFVGAPAIKMSQMRTYTNNTVAGASLQVVVPVGQYKPEKLINLGQNRWAFRPRVGISSPKIRIFMVVRRSPRIRSGLSRQISSTSSPPACGSVLERVFPGAARRLRTGCTGTATRRIPAGRPSFPIPWPSGIA